MVVWKPVQEGVRREIFDVVLGPNGHFSKVWLVQHIDFPSIESDCRLQIKQYHDGPCGAVASLQAWVMKNILFTDIKIRPRATVKERLCELRRKALIYAIADILWMVRPNKYTPAYIILPMVTEGELSVDDYFSSWCYAEAKSLEALRDIIEEKLFYVCRYGMVPFVCSMIMTRGTKLVNEEASKDTLIDIQNDDCFQPLINLMITGRAVTNVFDSPSGVKDYDHPSLSNYAITSQSRIGFLTSVEKQNSFFMVGKNLKLPHYPIWVIHGNFHYSMLFSEDVSVVSRPPVDQVFYWFTVVRGNTSLLNKQYTLKIIDKNSNFNRGCERSLKVIEDCIDIKWPGLTINVMASVLEAEHNRESFTGIST